MVYFSHTISNNKGMEPNQTSPLSPMQASAPAPVATPSPVVPPVAPVLPTGPEKLLTPQSSPTPPQKHSWGALIGIIIILLVLVVGALYFWGAKLAKEEIGGDSMVPLSGEAVLSEEMPVPDELQTEEEMLVEETSSDENYDAEAADAGFEEELEFSE